MMPGDTFPYGRVRLASLCAGAWPIAVQTLQTSQAMWPFPLGFCVCAGGRYLPELLWEPDRTAWTGSDQRLVYPQFCPLLKTAVVPQLSPASVCSLARALGHQGRASWDCPGIEDKSRET